MREVLTALFTVSRFVVQISSRVERGTDQCVDFLVIVLTRLEVRTGRYASLGFRCTQHSFARISFLGDPCNATV